MANILAALGYDVEMEYYFNNAGRQMRILGQSLQARYLQALALPAALPAEGYQGEYLAEVARQLVAAHGDALRDEPWERFKLEAERAMFAWIERSLALIHIHFDTFFNENSLYEDGSVWRTLEALEARGHVYRALVREGAGEEERAKLPPDAKEAVWFRATTFGDEEDRVLVKSSGEPTYGRSADSGARPGGPRLRPGAGARGDLPVRDADRGRRATQDEHAARRVRHPGRSGGGRGGRRGALLHPGAQPQQSPGVRPGPGPHNENPVYYIQNAHVRCAGIFRMAEQRGFSDAGADLSLLGEPETTFLRQALRLSETLVYALEEMAPHQIAFFALETARLFHPMYDNVRVFHSEVPEDVARARLRFYRAARVVFKRLLTLMGMSAPEVM